MPISDQPALNDVTELDNRRDFGVAGIGSVGHNYSASA
jgi:hypothetical protein